MRQHTGLVATLVAVGAGWSTIRHCRRLLHDGVGFDDGGGWTAVIMTEFMVFLVAVGAATTL